MTASQILRPKIIFISLLFYCFLLVGFVYGKVIFLPFFFDDLIILPYLQEQSFYNLLTTPAIFPYYRPVLPLIWKFLYAILGSHNTAVLHSLNLVLHALNAFLAAYFANLPLRKNAYTLPVRAVCMFLVASLYLIFPFHFQAVPWITAVYHILVTTFILITLIAYWKYQNNDKTRWLILGITASFLALFTQENGVLILPFLFFLELTLTPNWKNKQRWLRFLIWTLPYILWFPIWISRPQTTSELRSPNIETIFQNAVWLLQGLAFPLSWMGGEIHAAGYNDVLVTLCLGFIAIAFILLIYFISPRQQHKSRFSLLIYPLIFLLISALPILLLLPFAYLLSSPRLFTLPAVGIAWIWGITLTFLLLKIQQLWSQSLVKSVGLMLLWIGLLGMAFLPSWRFLNQQMLFHQMLGKSIDQVVEFTQEVNEAGNTAVILNFPYELGPQQTQFSLGHEGVVFLASYIPETTIVSTQTDAETNLAFVRLDDIRSQTPYIHGVLGSNNNLQNSINRSPQIQVASTTYLTESIQLQNVGGLSHALTNSEEATFLFDGKPALNLQEASFSQYDTTIDATFLWELTQPLPPEITIFIHVTNAEGQLIAQADGHSWGGSYPLAQWPPAMSIQDRRTIHLNDDVNFPIHVYVGFYHAFTGERLTALDASGNSVTNNAIEIFAE